MLYVKGNAMAEIRKCFGSKERAEGFAEGVRYVNDSDLEFIRYEYQPDSENPWVIILKNRDS